MVKLTKYISTLRSDTIQLNSKDQHPSSDDESSQNQECGVHMSVGGIIGLMPPKCLQSPLTLKHSQSACSICQRFTANYGYFVTPHVSLVSPLDSLLLGWDLSVT